MPRLVQTSAPAAAWSDQEPTSVTNLEPRANQAPPARPTRPTPVLAPTPLAAMGAETVPADLAQLEDRYELYEEFARGGMASVHLGRSITPGAPRVVAIKQLHAQLAWNPSFVAMFLDEGRLAARVHHPNVVAPLDFVVRAEQGELCLVMEYVHGETLSHLLTRAVHGGNQPTPAIAAGIMVGVLRGLQAAHEATTDDGVHLEIVHRDVSPQNIMVGADGVPRVLDFGVARAKMQDQPSGQRDRGGKPAYLAPEQIRFQKIDRRADLFSAGVVLWELLAGRRLFRHNDPRMVWVNILSGDIPPPSRYNPAISPALDRVALQAMERDRGKRFATARDFAQALIDTVDPAGPGEIGRWVHDVSGDVLNRRARRVAEIMAGPRSTTPMAAIAHPSLSLSLSLAALGQRLLQRLNALGARLSFRRRWSSLGLLVAALMGMALSAGSSRALLRRSDGPVAPAISTRPAATAVLPSLPPSLPAARIDTGPRAETPPRGPVATPPVSPPPVVAEAVAAPPALAQPAVAQPMVAPPTVAPPPDQPLAPEPAPVEALAVEDTALPPASEEAAPLPTNPESRPMRATRSGANARGKALARIDALNRRAMIAYTRGNYDTARLLLRTALTACTAARLQTARVAAETHAYLGVVLVTGFNQPRMAVEEFRQALRIDPRLPLARRYARPPVAAAFQEAAART